MSKIGDYVIKAQEAGIDLTAGDIKDYGDYDG